MMIRHAATFPSVLSLRRPFRTARSKDSANPDDAARQTTLLRLEIETPRGRATGWGESACLPAWGTEETAESRQLLANLTPPENTFGVYEIDAVFPNLRGSPAARFAVECSLLDALAQVRGEPLRTLLANGNLGDEHNDKKPTKTRTCRACDTLHVNATLGADAGPEAARRVAEAGYRCVKLKVGALPLDDDLARLATLAGALPEGTQLRLDANGAWATGEARRFLNRLRALDALSHLDIQYLEQPVADLDTLLELAVTSPVPLAVDEAVHPLRNTRGLLKRLNRREDSALSGQLVAILKPMALGGLLPALDFAERLRAHQIPVVFTSVVESAVGRTAVMHLAAAIGGSSSFAHGLATGELLKTDVHDAPPVRDGRLPLPDGPGLGLAIACAPAPRLESPRPKGGIQ